MPLIELSDYGNNDPEVVREIYDMHINLGKKPVFVKKDVPGMLANRLQEALLREAFSLVENSSTKT